jgi:hypothetical protein
MRQDERQSTPRPMWVKIGLWGLPNRTTAMFFFWLSIDDWQSLHIRGLYAGCCFLVLESNRLGKSLWAVVKYSRQITTRDLEHTH